MTDQADQGSALRKFFAKPQHIKIEVTNICNANCTFCAYQFMERKKDVMSMDVFRRVLDDYAQMGGGAVTLSSVVGDCLVDPHLLDRIRLMQSYENLGMVITFTNLIALDKWDDDAVLEFLEAIDLWGISLAPNPEVYRELFGVDRFERVVSNLQRLNCIRERARRKPRMRLLGRAVTGPFEIDERLVQIDEGLGDHCNWLTVYNDWGGVIPEQPRGTPVVRSSPEQSKTKVCMLPLLTTVIFRDGTVGLCGCADYDAALKIGHLENQKLEDIVSGERRRRFLESFEKEKLNSYCAGCTFYQPADEQDLVDWQEGKYLPALS